MEAGSPINTSIQQRDDVEEPNNDSTILYSSPVSSHNTFIFEYHEAIETQPPSLSEAIQYADSQPQCEDFGDVLKEGDELEEDASLLCSPTGSNSTSFVEHNAPTSPSTLELLLPVKQDESNTLFNWNSHVNRLLTHNGLPSLPTDPTQVEMYQILEHVIHQYEERAQVIQEVVWNSTKKKEEKRETEADSLRIENQELKTLLTAFETRIEQLKEQQTVLNSTSQAEINSLQKENKHLKQKLIQIEHKFKCKEKEYDNLRSRLESIAQQEQKKQAQHKQMFQELLKRTPRPTGVRASVHDTKVLEIISMFDAQRTAMESELQFLRKEVNNFSATLKLKENRSPNASKPEMKRMESTEWMKKFEELKKVNENLIRELESRPTQNQWKDLQRTNSILEKHLQSIRESRNHGNKGNKLSSDEKKLLDEICRELELNDTAKILPSIKQLESVVEVVPRMEKFIGGVCDVISRRSGLQVSDIGKIHSILSDVFNNYEELKGLREGIVEQLKRWKEACIQDKEPSNLDILQIVEKLIETSSNDEVHHFKLTEEQIKAYPEATVMKLMKHFQTLFEVKSLEGVLPKMNEIYLFVTETTNGIRALRSILQLEPHASLNSCISIVSTVMNEYQSTEKKEEDCRGCKSSTNDGEDMSCLSQKCNSMKERLEEYEKVIVGMKSLLKQLCDTLHVNSAEAIIPAVCALKRAVSNK